MRDPERIDLIIDFVRAYWKQNPDWRFGQLVINLIQMHYPGDPFYYEDDDLISFYHIGENKMLVERLR